MPKTAKHLWEEVISWENLIAAYHEARKRKRYKTDVMRFHRRWEEEILNIHNHLVWESWQPSPFSAFTVYEPKVRLIEAPAFRDRVVHHALHRVVEPLFERRFIHHSYACRKGRGTHAATAAVQRMLRQAQAKWGTVYVLQGDIARYFPSIDQHRLIRQLERVIGDRRVLELWKRIIFAQGADGVGLPIGALTSQLAANVYLDVLDHYVTDGLGYGLYARYMDDWIIMGPDKAALWRLLEHLTRWLDDELGLVINPKSTVYPASQGIDFAGYRTWATHTLPRKRNVTAARRRMLALAHGHRAGRITREEIRSSWASFAGYTKHCQAMQTRAAIAEEVREVLAAPL
jgi:hypothetical protein